jgi:hypothetical protein
MDDTNSGAQVSSDPRATELDIGGLRFAASFRGDAGATLRVYGPSAGAEKELIRFDDFVDGPHYHVPADGPSIEFDRAKLGEPLDWIIGQVRDHLGELLTGGGFADVLPGVDAPAITDNAEKIRALMTDCVPPGYVRVKGVGLRRTVL